MAFKIWSNFGGVEVQPASKCLPPPSIFLKSRPSREDQEGKVSHAGTILLKQRSADLLLYIIIIYYYLIFKMLLLLFIMIFIMTRTRTRIWTRAWMEPPHTTYTSMGAPHLPPTSSPRPGKEGIVASLSPRPSGERPLSLRP